MTIVLLQKFVPVNLKAGVNKTVKYLSLAVTSLLCGCASSGKDYISHPNTPENFNAPMIVWEYIGQNNSGLPMTMLTSKEKERFDAYVDWYGQRNYFTSVKDIQRYGNVIFAYTTLKHKEQRIQGWMALEMKDGKIAYSTLAGPPDNKGKKYLSEGGQAADTASTGIALSAGATEANPLMAAVIDTGGIPALGIVKLGVASYVRHYSLETCMDVSPALTSSGWGLAVANIGAITGVGAAAIIPALALAYLTWPEHDEQFWECVPSEYRQSAVNG